MDPKKHLIIAKGKVITSQVRYCKQIPGTALVQVTFTNGGQYTYSRENFEWLSNPVTRSAKNLQIRTADRELKYVVEIHEFGTSHYKFWHLVFADGTQETYPRKLLHVQPSCFFYPEARNVFAYLSQASAAIELETEDGTRLLAKQYSKLTFVDPASALACYLLPNKFPLRSHAASEPIFPFGCNSSQYQAVKTALSNKISIIQGPPGTGKTQTILNLICNLVLDGRSVLVASANNSAIANIVEKLSSPECGLGFLLAHLGNLENRTTFFSSQTGLYPASLLEWRSSTNSAGIDVTTCSRKLLELYETREELSRVDSHIEELRQELEHYTRHLGAKLEGLERIRVRRRLSRKVISKLLVQVQSSVETSGLLSVSLRMKCRLGLGIGTLSWLRNSPDEVLNLLQLRYYLADIEETSMRKIVLEGLLATSEIDDLAGNMAATSMEVLKHAIANRFASSRNVRRTFAQSAIRDSFNEFVKEYPVILSTTFSARNNVGEGFLFDYLIVDEASQVDIFTAALALSCAKSAVIVGDDNQLPNVVDSKTKAALASIFEKAGISKKYDASDRSFLQSIRQVLPDVPATMLREHYRCHPEIIGFCNERFYGGKMSVMTSAGNDGGLKVVRTVTGKHSRGNLNERQIRELIADLAEEPAPDSEIGIIAPYNQQVAAIRQALVGRAIEVDTVHRFQGREKPVIYVTTVDDEPMSTSAQARLSEDPNLLNVAFTRAQRKLCVIASGNQYKPGSVMADLTGYVAYHSLESKSGTISSIFDIMYQELAGLKTELLKKRGRISNYDSENLMYYLITEVLQSRNLTSLAVVAHYPLRMLIGSSAAALGGPEVVTYALNPRTHIDFLVYSRVSKMPVLAVEVDGFSYHRKESAQYARDTMKNFVMERLGIPLLRFSTTGVNEREQLLAVLDEILK